MFSGIQSVTQRVALAQAVLAPIAALIGALFAGFGAALAALFGGLVALAVSGVLVWRERQAVRHPEWDQHRLFKHFIRTGVERLLVLVGLLALGLAALQLSALPMLLGLLAGQLGWVAAALDRK
jgi:ATP synthase protein I